MTDQDKARDELVAAAMAEYARCIEFDPHGPPQGTCPEYRRYLDACAAYEAATRPPSAEEVVDAVRRWDKCDEGPSLYMLLADFDRRLGR